MSDKAFRDQRSRHSDSETFRQEQQVAAQAAADDAAENVLAALHEDQGSEERGMPGWVPNNQKAIPENVQVGDRVNVQLDHPRRQQLHQAPNAGQWNNNKHPALHPRMGTVYSVGTVEEPLVPGGVREVGYRTDDGDRHGAYDDIHDVHVMPKKAIDPNVEVGDRVNVQMDQEARAYTHAQPNTGFGGVPWRNNKHPALHARMGTVEQVTQDEDGEPVSVYYNTQHGGQDHHDWASRSYNDVRVVRKKSMDAVQPQVEPYGAQIIRRLHEDSELLLSHYDQMIGPLEHEPTKKLLLKKLQHLVGFLDEVDGHWNKHYGTLPPLGGQGEESGESVQAEDSDKHLTKGLKAAPRQQPNVGEVVHHPGRRSGVQVRGAGGGFIEMGDPADGPFRMQYQTGDRVRDRNNVSFQAPGQASLKDMDTLDDTGMPAASGVRPVVMQNQPVDVIGQGKEGNGQFGIDEDEFYSNEDGFVDPSQLQMPGQYPGMPQPDEQTCQVCGGFPCECQVPGMTAGKGRKSQKMAMHPDVQPGSHVRSRPTQQAAETVLSVMHPDRNRYVGPKDYIDTHTKYGTVEGIDYEDQSEHPYVHITPDEPDPESGYDALTHHAEHADIEPSGKGRKSQKAHDPEVSAHVSQVYRDARDSGRSHGEAMYDARQAHGEIYKQHAQEGQRSRGKYAADKAALDTDMYNEGMTAQEAYYESGPGTRLRNDSHETMSHTESNIEERRQRAADRRRRVRRRGDDEKSLSSPNRNAWEEWDERDRDSLDEAGRFLMELSEDGSNFDEDDRKKTYAYHKMLGSILKYKSATRRDLNRAASRTNKAPNSGSGEPVSAAQRTPRPTPSQAELEETRQHARESTQNTHQHGKGIKATDPAWPHVGDTVYDRGDVDLVTPMTVVDHSDSHNPHGYPIVEGAPDGDPYYNRTDLRDERGNFQSHYHDGMASGHPQNSLKSLVAVKDFFGSLSKELNFGDPHRAECSKHHKALKSLLGPEQADQDQLTEEEMMLLAQNDPMMAQEIMSETMAPPGTEQYPDTLSQADLSQMRGNYPMGGGPVPETGEVLEKGIKSDEIRKDVLDNMVSSLDNIQQGRKLSHYPTTYYSPQRNTYRGPNDPDVETVSVGEEATANGQDLSGGLLDRYYDEADRILDERRNQETQGQHTMKGQKTASRENPPAQQPTTVRPPLSAQNADYANQLRGVAEVMGYEHGAARAFDDIRTGNTSPSDQELREAADENVNDGGFVGINTDDAVIADHPYREDLYVRGHRRGQDAERRWQGQNSTKGRKGYKAVEPSYRDHLHGVYQQARRAGASHEDAQHAMNEAYYKLDTDVTIHPGGADPATVYRSITDIPDSYDAAHEMNQGQHAMKGRKGLEATLVSQSQQLQALAKSLESLMQAVS